MSTVQAMVCALMVSAHVMHHIWVKHVMFLFVQTIAAMVMESATMRCIAVTVKKGIRVCSVSCFHLNVHLISL